VTRRTQLAEYRRDDGITLSELLVAMMVFGVLSTIVIGLFAGTLRATDASKSLATNTAMASNGMNEVARVIRAGTSNPVTGQTLNDPAFPIAGNEELIIYAYVNLTSSEQTPVMIRYSVDSKRRLVETTWAAKKLAGNKWSFPVVSGSPTAGVTVSTPAARTRILASSVAVRASPAPWLFSYQRVDGTNLPLGPGGTLSPADARLVASVNVSLSIQGSTDNAASRVTVVNSVGIPNLGMNRKVP
jgi:prepilin-type N-terminal cleavage/methylation domain-containing protein